MIFAMNTEYLRSNHWSDSMLFGFCSEALNLDVQSACCAQPHDGALVLNHPLQTSCICVPLKSDCARSLKQTLTMNAPPDSTAVPGLHVAFPMQADYMKGD